MLEGPINPAPDVEASRCGGVSPSWNVLILSRHHSQAASSRLRTFQYVPYLEAQGARVHIQSFFDQAYLNTLYRHSRRHSYDVLRAYLRRAGTLYRARQASVVWVEKEVFPYLPGAFEGLLSRLNVPYVVDYDDATFHTYDRSRNPIVRAALRRKLAPLLRGAAAVTVGNEYLGNYARLLGARRVHQLPTVVDIARYPVDPEPRCDELRIGWIGSPSTTKYLEALREPLRQLQAERPVRLVTVGASPLQAFDIPVEQHRWTEDTEASLIAGMHIGVMPLPDAPWERAKCGYKLIQYMASGRPVIASPVGVNSDIVKPDTGFLASSPEEWLAGLSALGSDASLRSKMGMAGRRSVERTYSLGVTAPRIVALLRQAAAGTKA